MEKATAPQLIIDLIEDAKTAAGVTADNALAVRLGWHRQMINHYRLGTKPTNENLLMLCEIANRDFNTTVIAVEKAFAKSEEAKTRWDRCMKRLGGIAASFVVGIILNVTLIVTPSPAKAGNTSFYNDQSAGIQIMRSYRRVAAFVRNTLKMLLLRVYWPYSPNNGITA